MTRDALYGLVSGLLSADGSSLPSDIDRERLGLLEMAMEMTVMESEPAMLTFPVTDWNDGSLNNRRFIRSVTVGMNEDRDEFETKVIVAPILPENADDELDIDHGLCFAVARFMTSMLCKIDYYNIHTTEAKRLCKEYTSQTIAGVPTDMDT